MIEILGHREEADLVLVFGPGLRGGPEEMVRRFSTTSIAVFEPRPEKAAAFSEYAAVPEGGLIVLTDWIGLNEFLVREVVHGRHARPEVFIHPDSREEFRVEVEDFENILRGATVTRAVNDKTLREKGLIFLEHLADNFRVVLELPLFTGLKDRLPGIPGFIVGSAPSLEKNGKLLAEVKSRGVILAASSALKPLAELGVSPDAVVVIETEDTSEYLTREAAGPEILLAAASTSHPGHFLVPGFLTTSFHLSPGAAYMFGADQFAPQAGTAGSAAFTLGLMVGLDPLVLVGQDQAYGSGRLHALGTPGEASPDEAGAAYTALDAGGRWLPTHSAFAASLHWYTESVRFLNREHPGRRIINASEGGAKIPGVSDVPLAQVMKSVISKKKSFIGPAALFPELPRPDLAEVRLGLADTWQSLGRILMLLRHAPEETAAASQELKNAHPFLRLALSGLEPDEDRRTIMDRLEQAENVLLRMMEEVNR